MADWPYNTAAWQRLRKAKLAATPMCEVCTKSGRLTPASHVDHIEAINAGGDPFPPLNGLMAMCPSCHSIKTNALDRAGGSGIAFRGVGLDGLPIDRNHPFMGGRHVILPLFPQDLRGSRPSLTIVCGPPASGKSWYVEQFADVDDVVIDLDEIGSRLAGGGGHSWSRRWIKQALEERNAALRSLSTSSARRAWFIVSEPTPERREWWSLQLNAARVVVIETPQAVCFQRIEASPDRWKMQGRTRQAVERWWSLYRRRSGEERYTPSKDEGVAEADRRGTNMFS